MGGKRDTLSSLSLIHISTLEYYVNEKASAIAPKVTDVGASTVDRTVNSTFVSTVSEVLTEVINTVAGKAISLSLIHI